VHLTVYLLTMKALGSQRSALQVIVNVPLAALGAIVALLIVNRPEASEFVGQAWYLWPGIWIQAAIFLWRTGLDSSRS